MKIPMLSTRATYRVATSARPGQEAHSPSRSEDGAIADLAPFHVDLVRWELIEVRADGCESLLQLVDRIRNGIETAVFRSIRRTPAGLPHSDRRSDRDSRPSGQRPGMAIGRGSGSGAGGSETSEPGSSGLS